MGSNSKDLLRQYDLLPPVYLNQYRLRHVHYSWLAIVGSLMIVLACVSLLAAWRTHQDRRIREMLALKALPLFDLRQDVQQMQANNARRTTWCQWVESARPDDNALQTLAAVATASAGQEEQITVDRLSIKLPLEYPAEAKQMPAWAAAEISVAAQVDSSEAIPRWLDRLNVSDRIAGATTVVEPAGVSDGSIELIARPVVTRVLP